MNMVKQIDRVLLVRQFFPDLRTGAGTHLTGSFSLAVYSSAGLSRRRILREFAFVHRASQFFQLFDHPDLFRERNCAPLA
ncbi:MAG: hypothetical protein JO354_12710 [Verrucomicrobia bacterium]|nr:hypothetical protein [Verrucomicrobiota bacterium]